MRRCVFFAFVSVAAVGAASAREHSADFDGPDALKGWTVKGAVSVDKSRGRTGAAIRIDPGGVALWKLREEEGAGEVDLWVHEDTTVPADPKKRRVSPRWGLLATGGRALVVGPIYAPYLNGKATYAASDYRGETWFNVTYLGQCRRKEGWHRWTFTMDAEKGLSIAMDGKDVNARRKRFDWNRTKFTGMVGVAIFGDNEKAGGQTIWVDDVTVTLGGPVKVKPVPPPPPPPVVPEKDPPAERKVQLVEAVRRKLLRHARAMYHGGHLMKNRSATQYWQQDPQNNHRWHRDAGLALCALAASSGKAEEEWILEKTLEELKFVHDWLPADGTSHEGPGYHVFGGNHLTLAMHAADRCLGTKYLQHPFFRGAPLFRIHTLTPGLKGSFCFGDGGGLGGYHNFVDVGPSGGEAVTVRVKAKGVSDTWTQQAPPDGRTPSHLIGKRGAEALVEVTGSDRPPGPERVTAPPAATCP